MILLLGSSGMANWTSQLSCTIAPLLPMVFARIFPFVASMCRFMLFVSITCSTCLIAGCCVLMAPRVACRRSWHLPRHEGGACVCVCACARVCAYGAARRMADAVDTSRGMKEVCACVRVCAPLCGLMALRIAWPTRLTLGAAWRRCVSVCVCCMRACVLSMWRLCE